MNPFEIPWKQVFKTPDGRTILRYKNSGINCLVEVQEFDDNNLFMHRHDQFMQYCHENNMPLVVAQTDFDGKQYLLTCNEFIFYRPKTPEKQASYLAHKIKKLADWYRFQVLMKK